MSRKEQIALHRAEGYEIVEITVPRGQEVLAEGEQRNNRPGVIMVNYATDKSVLVEHTGNVLPL